ncbi:sulfur oxidation c-type cytochrome SoxX [Prosthecomicrobium sp. N25]|uniref:sulfur oxidation c-type cytochrome SoxX n=1 Tax=Prosthecomicrobium sp. N25 TaxID=3129254 RepID=UPI00307831F7
MGRAVRLLAVALAAAAGGASPVRAGDRIPDYVVVGDGIPAPLEGRAGDPLRGRAIVADRTAGLCLMCHAAPIPEVRQQGDLAPDLAGAGSRWTAAQLRLRLVDARRLNPASIMPPTLKLDGLVRVQARFRDRTILDPQAIEDVVAYLETLR